VQCDFQVIYASGIKGKAGLATDNLADDLGPLFEAILRCIPEPRIEKDGDLQMLVSSILSFFLKINLCIRLLLIIFVVRLKYM
jgi:predicted membrane GTPase involved in stress response